MLGIDTNILVRYITQDGYESRLATKFLEKYCSNESPGFICLVVLCELVWVLESAYKYEKIEIVEILDKLLTASEFEIENSLAAWRALQIYSKGSADFTDYLIGYVCGEYDTDTVMTLDKKAAKSNLFTLLDSKTV